MTSRLRAVVLGAGGVGALIGTGLLALTGLLLMFAGTFELLPVSGGPKALGCSTWLDHPSQAKWVALTGCRLELVHAAQLGFPDWRGGSDGGLRPDAPLQLPIGIAATEQTDTVRAVVLTRNPVLRGQAAELAKATVPIAPGALAGLGPNLSHLLVPEPLQGTVDTSGPIPVLEQDAVPVSGRSLCNVALGFFLLMAALWPMARRLQLQRELDAQKEPPAPGGPAA